MKKLICLILCLMLLLCACAPQNNTGSTENTTTGTAGTTDSTSGSSENTEASTSDLKALAESCIGKTVQELYELIGEPESAEYVSSCLGPGDDGNLFYDGFIVYTYREGDTETVEYVE